MASEGTLAHGRSCNSLLINCSRKVEDQWLPREDADGYAGHLRTTVDLSHSFSSSRRMSEGPNFSPKKYSHFV